MWKCLLRVTVLTDTPVSSMGSGSWAKEVHSGVDKREAQTLPRPVIREVGARAEAAGRQIEMMPAQVPKRWLGADSGLAAVNTGLHPPAQPGGSQGLPRLQGSAANWTHPPASVGFGWKANLLSAPEGSTKQDSLLGCAPQNLQVSAASYVLHLSSNPCLN